MLPLVALLLSLSSAPAADLPDLLLADPVRSGARAAADSAVVIGVEDYAFVPDVPYAARDAQSFRDFLVYTRGLLPERVRLLTSAQGSAQASRERMVEALSWVGQNTAAGGTVWVYFAGHGLASPQDGQRLVLGDDVRADESSLLARGLPVEELRSLAAAGGAQVLLVADACYGGVGRGGEGLMGGKRFLVPDYAGQESQGQLLEWNGAGPNQLTGPFHPVRQGAFTYFAVGALRGWADGELDGRRDGRVTAGEAQNYVARALRAAQIHGQVPV